MIYKKLPKVKKEKRFYNVIIARQNVYTTTLKEANQIILNALKSGDKSRMQIRIEDVYLHSKDACFSASSPFKFFNW